MGVLLKKGQVIDPTSNLNMVKDILITDGEIVSIKDEIEVKKEFQVINIQDEIVMPALFDVHTHLRTPGREDEETLLSGAKAALKGGFTRVCCMPNTIPPLDNAGLIEFIINQSRYNDIIDIFPVGAITKIREGRELTEMYDLKRAGAVAFSDDGLPVMNSHLMRRALEYANMLNLPIISHCEDLNLSSNGQINEGYISTLLGLGGIPKESEISMVARDISLSKMTGAHLHIAHISCKESVELVRLAKKEGLNVTCETCPHYFSLTEESVKNFNTNTKVNPPLRTEQDVDLIIEGLCDGTIDVIASDHAPHAVQEKDLEFDKAPFGMIGLETALSLTITKLIRTKIIDWKKMANLMSVNPATIVNEDPIIIKEGTTANLVIIKMEEWIPSKDLFYSLSCNTPYFGKPLTGIVDYVFCKGRMFVNQGKVDINRD